MPTIESLKLVPFFANLSTPDLERLSSQVEEVNLPKGKVLFAEGSPGDRAYVIEDGELEITKKSGGSEILLAIRREGELIGEMALLQNSPRTATVRAVADTRLLAISFDQLNELIDENPAAARTMLETVAGRLREQQTLLRQSEKMAQLGNMAAGLAHELNNPATAALRSADQLAQTAEQLQDAFITLEQLGLSEPQLDLLKELDKIMRAKAAEPGDLDALARSDKEAEVEAWLESLGAPNGWQVAPTLVNLNLEQAFLTRLSGECTGEKLFIILNWIHQTFSVYTLLEEVRQGATRISEIVNALRSYSFLDQAPVQSVDIHKGLDDTLVLLRNKLKKGVAVHREYTANLPRINAYGSELNQVWTNLIDNAVDAMDSKGELVIRTRLEDGWVVVEIQDSGPGIPADVLPRIFEAYFTTKPVGKGTGLGLDITRKIITEKHGGEISVESEPGRTVFRVQLPISPK